MGPEGPRRSPKVPEGSPKVPEGSPKVVGAVSKLARKRRTGLEQTFTFIVTCTMAPSTHQSESRDVGCESTTDQVPRRLGLVPRRFG